MSHRFQDRYRISSTRLQNWDYSRNGLYFVTINTQGQEEYFGEIEKGHMYLSNLGSIADILWYEIKNHFDFVELDQFVVMPNHVHGILGIKNPENYETGIREMEVFFLDKKSDNSPGEKRKGKQEKNALSSIIGSYKSAILKHAHRLNYRFSWQSRFYDQIIRDEKSLINISSYIANNISNWDKDSLNKKWEL
mgnify:CR=1 FL=1